MKVAIRLKDHLYTLLINYEGIMLFSIFFRCLLPSQYSIDLSEKYIFNRSPVYATTQTMSGNLGP